MYYSGLDVVVSARVPERDLSFPLDLYDIEFAYEQPKAPIYGYNHNIMKTKMQGTVIVHGAFSVNLSKPDVIRNSVAHKYARTSVYFDVDIKSHRWVNGTKEQLTFDEAFSEARRMVGAGKTFRFNGKTYSTSTKDETKGLASVSWGQYRTGDTLNLQLDFINSSAIGTAEAVLTTGEKYIGQENTLGLLINNVEITSRAQRVTPSPENILEVYQFIARNVSTF